MTLARITNKLKHKIFSRTDDHYVKFIRHTLECQSITMFVLLALQTRFMSNTYARHYLHTKHVSLILR
jgi:hypothetical protein